VHHPLVSILIPAYNAGRWVGQTLSSAVAQTWPNTEVVLVDDGSKDDTLAIARRFESSKVKVLSQPNSGASAARNLAFRESQGEFIQWLDADDLLAPDKIARQMEVALQSSPRRMLSGEWGSFESNPSRARFSPTGLWTDLSPIEWMLRKMTSGAGMQPATWLVRRELTEAAGPWDVRLSLDDDGEYFARVLFQSEGTAFVPGAKVYYRAPGPSNLSYAGRSSKKLESQYLSLKLHIGYTRAVELSPRVDAACVQYLQWWCGHFVPDRMDLFEQLAGLAKGFGGELSIPKLSWKYEWIKRAFGWESALRVREGIRRGRKVAAQFIERQFPA
jgi:glycosyltransferase involved in cell wall biosynthesis